MRIGVPKEIRASERRVALSPEVAGKLAQAGHEVRIETAAGENARIPDSAFAQAGAIIVPDACTAFGADVVLKVQRPVSVVEGGPDEIAWLHEGAGLIGLLAPFEHRDQVEAYAARGLTAFAMEFIPRITRAQSMDALSSQSTVAGYRAVIEAAHAFGRLMPLMMTAAGTVAPAKVLVLGAGVAGLQAIATARRLGGVVSAFDVRPAVKEEVQSLGARFLEVAAEEAKAAQTEGGYAREMSAAFREKQRAVIGEALKKSDIAISTALIPGKPAPRLITAEMVESMAPGSVIVDLAVASGGNCALSELDKVVEKHGVTIIGYGDMASRAPTHASAFYAKNLFNLLQLMTDKESKAFRPDWEDEIVRGALLTREGRVVSEALARGGL